LKKSLRDDRNLPGIDFNDQEQLDLLDKFDFNAELQQFPVDRRTEIAGTEFLFNNQMYGPGDAEYLYNMIRFFKPSKIMEIGSGQSTLMALNAIEKTKQVIKLTVVNIFVLSRMKNRGSKQKT
jgi:predicted O-methyltransferase YrrM